MDEIRIREVNPSGRDSIKALVGAMTNMANNSDNMSPTFNDLVPITREKVRYTFSESNPGGWAELKATYKAWKTKHGYPVTIGIMTGALKDSLTTQAQVTIERKRMIYEMNPGLENKVTGKRTGQYGHYFNEKREILPYVKRYMQSIIKMSVKKAIAEGYNNRG